MSRKKYSTQYTGVRYREHDTRTHSNRPDRYFFIRYKLNSKDHEEGLGWASEGMTAKRASLERAKLREAHRTGVGSQSLKEHRAEKQQQALDHQRELLQLQKERLTFNELAVHYLEWAKANKKTWIWDERRLRLHIQPVIGQLMLKDISTPDIELLKQRCIGKEMAPASVNHCLQLVRGVYNFGIRFDFYIGSNPAQKVRLLKHDNKRVRFLARNEAEALLAEVRSRSEDWYQICLISLYTGMRFGEIMALTWPAVDLDHKVLHIFDPKSGETRQAYLGDKLLATLGERKEVSESNLVFPGRFGQLVKKVSHTFTRSVEAIGLNDGIDDPRQKITFHCLRHTFASWLAMQGTPLLTIKELLGHKTVEMTMRYAHLIPDQKRDAVQKLEEAALL
ncbi:MAG: tyrosine-type recombinase/integrase [Desulfovibrio sp.]